MHPPEDLTPAQRELESALQGLRPDPAGVNPVGRYPGPERGE